MGPDSMAARSGNLYGQGVNEATKKIEKSAYFGLSPWRIVDFLISDRSFIEILTA